MKELKISYVIGTHNEGEVYLRPLFISLLKNKDENDEIIVVDDYSDEPTTTLCLEEFSDKIKVVKRKFEGNFAEHKNFMISLCSGDYIFNIDGDELPSPSLLQTIKEIILNNENVELFYVPRINIVQGLTQEDVNKWGWSLNEQEFINFPDPQGRIFKRKDEIKWEGKVHERVNGSSAHSVLPAYDETGKPIADYTILHIKSIDRQREQNSLYDKLIK